MKTLYEEPTSRMIADRALNNKAKLVVSVEPSPCLEFYNRTL